MRHAVATIQVSVTDPQPPRLIFQVDHPVPPGVFLRLKANSVFVMRALRITRMQITGAAAPLPFYHCYPGRDAGPEDKSWALDTRSLAVVYLDDPLPAQCHIEVDAAYAPPCEWEVEPDGRESRYAGVPWTLTLGRAPHPQEDAFEPIAPPVHLDFIAGPPDHLEAYLRHDGRITFQHFDAFGNPAASDGSCFTLQTPAGPLTYPAEPGVQATDTVLPDALRALLPRPQITITDDAGRKAVTPAWPAALDGAPVYFGEFHWHSAFSGDDGRPLEDVLRSAREELALDFAGPADHVEPGGGFTLGRVSELAGIAQAFDDPGHFCVLPGAELHGRYAHANLYTDTFPCLIDTVAKCAAAIANAAPGDATYPWPGAAAVCPPGHSVLVPHHTNMDVFARERALHGEGQTEWRVVNWSVPPERTITRLVEIVQSRGAFESEEPESPWLTGAGGLGGSIRTALMRGYRTGFVGGTDTHFGWPTRAGAGYCGITGVIAPSLDTASIFQALHQRRCYATSGARIVASATLNGMPMGAELRLAPATPRQFHIAIHGTAPLCAVQLFDDGFFGEDFEVNPNLSDFVIAWEDNRPGKPYESTYYYIRARQQDGHCVWLSPFWIDFLDS